MTQLELAGKPEDITTITAEEVKENPNLLLYISKHNHLIRSALSFGTVGSRFLALLVCNARVVTDGETPSYCRLSDALDYTPGAKDYKRIHAILDKMRTTGVDLLRLNPKKPNDYHTVNIFSEISLESKTGIIRCNFTNGIRPYLWQMSNLFSSAQMKDLLSLKSGYSYNFYWLMLSYESLGDKLVAFEELHRSVVGETKKYSSWSDFRKFVLEPALEEVQPLMHVVMGKPITQGKKVTHLHFLFDPKKKLEAEARQAAKGIQGDMFSPPPAPEPAVNPLHRQIYERLRKNDLSDFQANQVLANYQGDLSKMADWADKVVTKGNRAAHIWSKLRDTWKADLPLEPAKPKAKVIKPTKVMKDKVTYDQITQEAFRDKKSPTQVMQEYITRGYMKETDSSTNTSYLALWQAE